MRIPVLAFVFAFTFLGASFNSQGQIALTSTDLTSIGDQITRYSDTVPTYGPGAAGAGVTWDFSGAINDTASVTSVVSVGSTPFASQFSGSDYAMTGGADSYLYFIHNANTMITTGAAGDLLGTGEQIQAVFTDPLILHQFPRTYQSNFNDTYQFQAEADGASFGVYRIRLTHTGNVFDTTDAYGTLITPTGTYDALRVKSTDFTTDVIEVKLAQFLPWTNFTTVMDTSVTYSWHAKEEKLAIAEFAFDSVGDPARFTYSAVPPISTVDVANYETDTELRLYPQPAAEELFIQGLNPNANHRADVFSIDGKLIRTETLTSNSLYVADLRSGMYFLRITLADGTHKEPLKFIVR